MSAVASQITSLTIVYSIVSRRRSKKTSKLRVTGLCEGNSPVIGEFPAQRASNAENFAFDDVIMFNHIINLGGALFINVQLIISITVSLGLYSLWSKTSCRQISWSLEATGLDVMIIISFWKGCLSNSRTFAKSKLESRVPETLRDLAVRRQSTSWIEIHNWVKSPIYDGKTIPVTQISEAKFFNSFIEDISCICCIL